MTFQQKKIRPIALGLALALIMSACSQDPDLATPETDAASMPDEDRNSDQSGSDMSDHQSGDGDVETVTSSDDEEDQDSEPVADPE